MKANEMKAIILRFSLLVFTASFGLGGKLYAQCGSTGCNDNTFLTVTDPNTMVYDNIVSSFHSSIAKKWDGSVWVWGENSKPDGLNHQLTPVQVTPVNGYNYTGNILLFTAGSNSMYNAQGTGTQFTLLTTSGLYAWGNQAAVYDNTVSAVFGNAVKTTSSFGLLVPRGGNTPNNGLPLGVMPNDIRMLYSTGFATAILTCSGNVWVLSRAAAASYGNNTPNASAGFMTQNTWQQVQQSAVSTGNPLSNVVAVRGASGGNFVALKGDGTVWTWGSTTYLGNGTAMASRPYAQQMTLPTGVTPKMIGMTNQNGYPGTTAGASYYLLGTNGNVYSLGRNERRQLGDFTVTERTSWVQVHKSATAGDYLTNVAWISPQEHDGLSIPAINVLTADGKLWAWGDNHGGTTGSISGGMLGGSTFGPIDPFTPPQGILATDKIAAVETGGHTSVVIKECEKNFGYVGHRVNGSMGNTQAADGFEPQYNFETVEMPLCAAGNAPDITTLNGTLVCNGFTVASTTQGSANQWSLISGPATIGATTGVLTITGPGPITVSYGGAVCQTSDTVTLQQADFGNLDPSTWPVASATNLASNSAWLGAVFPTTDCQTNLTDPADGLTITGVTGSGTNTSPWQLTKGQSYNLNVTVNGNGTSKPVYWAVWYDVAGDGDFTDADDIFQTGNTTHGSPVTAPPFSVTIPATAGVKGAMRVVATAVNTTFTKAMNGQVALTNGEVEDFYVQTGIIQPCPGSLYAVGDAPGTGISTNKLYIVDPVTLQPAATYTLPYTGTTGAPGAPQVGSNAIATPGDGYAYTVSRQTGGNTLARTIYKTDLATGVTASTGIVLPAFAAVGFTTPTNNFYISGASDAQGNIYFTTGSGHAVVKVNPTTGAVTTLWSLTSAAQAFTGTNTGGVPPFPNGGDFVDMTIDANGDIYFIEDYTKRLWQITATPGSTGTPPGYTAYYRGQITNDALGGGFNTQSFQSSDIMFGNGKLLLSIVPANTALPNVYEVNLGTNKATLAPNSDNDPSFTDVANLPCAAISLAKLGGRVFDDNNGQTGGVNGTPMAGVTVTLYAADGVTVVATTTTDANGYYSFDNVSPNTTYIVAVMPPFGYGNVSSSDGITPTDGKTTVAIPASGSFGTSVDFGMNQPPVTGNDTLTGQIPGTVATVPNILGNDSDPNGGTLSPDSISLVFPAGATNPVVDAQGDTIGFTVPGQGTWTLNPNGSVSFTPQAGFAGDPASINYTITDAAGLKSNIGTIVIDYDYPPVAVNDTASTPMNTPLNSTVTNNDTCRDGPCNYTPLSSDPPVNGTVTLHPDGTYTYTPNTGFTGTDTFSYVICNSGVPVRCDTASVFITVLSVLPADLLSFKADIGAPCDVQLSWTTGVETNLYAFEIESGIDGAVFRKAGSVAAHGFGSSYTYRYSQGAEGRNYFRLKMIDLNGSYAYSRVAMIDLSCTGTRDIRVYPAVVKGQLTIDGLQWGESVSVYDMNGRRALLAKADGPQAVLDLSALSQGSYVVVVVTLTGEPVHYKIMKQ